MRTLLHLDEQAPPKPAFGAPCNGCGVCCAAELCPLGRVVYRRIEGPCPALEWVERDKRYRCRLATPPGPGARGFRAEVRRLSARLARRWIAAGRGCDSTVEVAGL